MQLYLVCRVVLAADQLHAEVNGYSPNNKDFGLQDGETPYSSKDPGFNT